MYYDTLNRNNNFRSFKHDWLKFGLDITKVRYKPEHQFVINRFRVDARLRASATDIQMRRRTTPAPLVNRLGIPNSSGYSLCNSRDHLRFHGRLFNLLQANGFFEPKLLVNHAGQIPLYTRIFPDKSRECTLGITKEYLRPWHAFLVKCISLCNPDDVAVYKHKTSTIGPPFLAYGRVPFSRLDVTYGLDVDFRNSSKAALRKDYSGIKSTYDEHILEILINQLNLAEQGFFSPNIDHIQAYLDGYLPVAVPGYRFNNWDPAVVDSNYQYNEKDKLYPKSRRFGEFLVDGAIFGDIDIKNLSNFVWELLEAALYMALVKIRVINNLNYVSQLPASIHTKMVTHFIEHSVNGFASNKSEVIDSYKRFLSSCNLYSGKMYFLNGDRKNAEAFISTNYSQFEQLILPEYRKMYAFQDTCVFIDNNSIACFEGLPSGIARTTELNWYMGTFESLYTISKLTGFDLTTVSTAYFKSVLDEADYFSVPGYKIKLFMTTDDIPLVIYSERDHINLDWLNSAEVDKRSMEWSVSEESMTTFGMHFDTHGLTPAPLSIFSKLFYSEKPGFFCADCFSLVQKMKLVDYSLRKDIIRLYTSHFSTDWSLIDSAAKAFESWLKEFGVPLEAAVGIYSPAAQVIFGDRTSSDPIFQNTRIQTQYIEPTFNMLKSMVKEDAYAF